MDNIYKNIEDYNPNKKRMVADMFSSKKLKGTLIQI